MSKRTIFALLLCALAVRAAETPEEADARRMKALTGVLDILQTYNADPVDPQQAFYQGAIPAMLRHLDPHSIFFDTDQFQQVKEMETSTHKGFGSVVSVLPGRVMVLQTTPNTPSARAGMMPGDEILAVNNYRLDRLEFEQIVELLGASKQKPAQLVVRHPGATYLTELTLVPQDMQSSSVDRAFLLKPGVGYVRVTSFEEKTGAQIREAIEKIGGNQLQALVLDLRNNPGGVVGAALDTASMFLKTGQMILSAKGRNVPEKIERVPEENNPYNFRLAVLVNAKTASASEIVSGSLQDHDRAVIVGEPTFGKGLVQGIFPLAEGTGLALTTALYYIPSGRSIQKPFARDEFELGATAKRPNERTDFKSDSGRPMQGGGGIVPDIEAHPADMTRFGNVLEASGAFTAFAGEYVQQNKIADGWEPEPTVLDAFRVWLSDRRIQPSQLEWSAESGWIRTRLKSEVYTLALGVEKGDEVEASIDAQIQRALEAITSPAR